MELRQYQKDAISICSNAFNEGLRSYIIELPTGAGKTVVFSEMAKNAAKNGYAVLIITDSKKLHAQTEAYFKKPILIKAGADPKLTISGGDVAVGMAQTLSRRTAMLKRLNNLGQNLIVIVDECHIATSCAPLKHLTDTHNIGFSATPVGSHLYGMFGRIYNVITIAELIKQGFLSPCESWIRRVVNTGSIKKKGGEFDDKSQEEAFRVGYKSLVTDLSHAIYKKAVVFTSSIKQCDSVSNFLKENGIDNAVVHSERDELSEFYNDKDVCVSVGMLTKGFDYPSIDLVILFRATESEPLYLQMCGRGSRVLAGKKKFTVIDYGGNILRHGLWASDRVWEIKPPNAPKEEEDNVISSISVHDCESCGYVSLESFTECPNCGYEPTVEIEHMETEIVSADEIKKDPRSMSPKDLYEYAKKEGRLRYAIGIARRKGSHFLLQYAKAAGYSQSWVYRMSKLKM